MSLLGGALLRGISLQSRHWMVGAYRRGSGAIVLAVAPSPQRDGVRALPFVRGLAVFADNTFPRLSLMEWSSAWEQAELEGPPPPVAEDAAHVRVERLVPAESRVVLGPLLRTTAMLASVVVLTQLATEAVLRLVAAPPALFSLSFQLWTAAATIALAIAYGRLIQGMAEIPRVFQYNAVLLRTVALHERGVQPDAAKLQQEPSFHPRGAASNILLSMAITPWITWLAASRIATPTGWWTGQLLLVILKLATAPFVLALAYEAAELLSALYEIPALRSPVRALLFLQRFYVREPTRDQLELGLVVHRKLVGLEIGEHEPEPEALVGLGGHGLLLAPRSPCAITLAEDGTLAIQAAPLTPRRAVVVAPRSALAAEAPQLRGVGIYHCGADGPTFTLDGVEDLDDLLLQVDVGLGESPWVVMGPGFVIDLPTGFTVLAAHRDDGAAFEVHRGVGADALEDELMVLEPRGVPAGEVAMRTPPDCVCIEGSSPGETGPVRTWELTYVRGGEGWVQRFYALPLVGRRCILLRAQSRAATWPILEAAADRVAASFAPLA